MATRAVRLTVLVSLLYTTANCRVALAQLFSAPGTEEARKFGLPLPEDFSVKQMFSGRPAQPILNTPGKRLYRTVIRQEVALGPNFAGHYRVVQWGCGTECIRAVIVDAITGDVLLPPVPPFTHEVRDVPALGYLAAMEDGGLSFTLRSSLLVIQGCASAANCGTYYYNLKDGKFVLAEIIHVCREDYGEKEAQCGKVYWKHFPDSWGLKTQSRQVP